MTGIEKLLAVTKIDSGSIGYKDPIKDPGGAFADILTLVYMWAAIIAVFIIIVASFLFVTSRGDATQMKRSKDAIRGAVVGLVVVMLAFTITQFVLGRF